MIRPGVAYEFLEAMPSYASRENRVFGDFLRDKQRVEVLGIQVMKEDAVPVHLELLDDRSGDCMVEACFIGMSEDDRYIHDC